MLIEADEKDYDSLLGAIWAGHPGPPENQASSRERRTMTELMDFNVDSRTILLVRHGSHAYGMATPDSDEDRKGVCIEPKEVILGYLYRFENDVKKASEGAIYDQVIFSLRKFGRLAGDSNPSVVEMLFTDEEDVIYCNEFGRQLLAHKNIFLSKKVKYTFCGLANEQLRKMKTHRGWLLNPPTHAPTREEYGLDKVRLSNTQYGAYGALSEEEKKALSDEALSLYSKERAYRTARNNWHSFCDWQKHRNPKRAAAEAKAGYDGKAASHIIRYLRMCKEILRGDGVILRRPDREELLAIKRGEWLYDRVVEHAEELTQDCDSLYVDSPLREQPDHKRINDLVVKLTEEYLRVYN